MEIPEPVQTADQALHALLQRVAFSRYLNPMNVSEARQSFKRSGGTPPFRYQPLTEADDLLRELDAMQPPRDHPAGILVGQCIDSVHRLVSALQHRTAEAFDAMNLAAGWYDGTDAINRTYPSGSPTGPMDVPALVMIEQFEHAFAVRNMRDWSVVEDEVMSARVLVDSAKRLVRINPNARFRSRDLTRLVVHEIDVHARRATNGTQQPLLCFQTGLPGSLATEEGLAMVAEETSGTASPGAMARQVEVVRAIHDARELGFSDLYTLLLERVGRGMAWGICLRVKRGLSRPDLPGVYAKDSVYLTGRNRVRDWLDDGGDIAHLYVGKVSTSHPIEQWLSEGWITPQPVPALWS